MRSIGYPEVLVLFFPLVIGIGVFGVVFFILWKCYQMFSKINENIAAIRREVERHAGGTSQ